jgi:tRNA U34 5-methylaminomethyl-2-thiouridine-forming methyltransferase MnmC
VTDNTSDSTAAIDGGAENQIYTAITEDGSLSLVSGEYTELYHNRAGAYSEALLSYSRVALSAWSVIYGGKLPSSLNVLDCCFGLGYNSFVLAQEVPDGVSLDITGVELDPRVLALLPRILSQPCLKPLAQMGFGPAMAANLIRCKKCTINSESQNRKISIRIIQSCLRTYLRDSPERFSPMLNLILHDPFSPKKMAELWTIDLFVAYRERLDQAGIILTYSSAPAVRGALLDLGFRVYRTPAQGGKSCGTLAIPGDDLESAVASGLLEGQVMPLEQEELRRLGKSSRVPYRDPGLVFDRAKIMENRLAEQKRFFAGKN